MTEVCLSIGVYIELPMELGRTPRVFRSINLVQLLNGIYQWYIKAFSKLSCPSVLLKKTFRRYFYAGKSAGEINQAVNELRKIGYKGAFLNYAKEISLDDDAASSRGLEADDAANQNEIIPWAKGTM